MNAEQRELLLARREIAVRAAFYRRKKYDALREMHNSADNSVAREFANHQCTFYTGAYLAARIAWRIVREAQR